MLRQINLLLVASFVLAACGSPTPTATQSTPSNTAVASTATRAVPTATTRPPTATIIPATNTPSASAVKVEPRPAFAVFVEEPVNGVPSIHQDPIDPQMGNVLVPTVLSTEQLQFMAQTGLVASPRDYPEFSQLYFENLRQNVPMFVTSDMFLHGYHLIFDKTLRDLEEQVLLRRLQKLHQLLVPRANQQYIELQDTPWAEAALHVWAYLSVGAALADPNFTPAPGVADLVNAELGLIEAAAGPAPSPIFPLLKYGEDYSQYVPRSHYTRSDQLRAYFKAMMWYGRMTFRLHDAEDPQVGPSETRMAILLTALMGDEEAQALWAELYDPTAFLVGRSDDLTIHEYRAVFETIYAPGTPAQALANEAALEQFIAATNSLPAPRILGLISDDYKPLDAVKGLRFMGQRFVPDAYIFQELIHPKVAQRWLPTGLDVMAVLGSERAAVWLAQDPTTQNPQYPAQTEKLTQWLNDLPQAEWTETAYNSWLYTLRPLVTTVRSDGYPLFMQSTAWQDKQLNTALSSWAELKHDTLLYAKQPYGGRGGGGGGPQPPDPVFAQNYVEPEPAVFARLAALAQLTERGLAQNGAWQKLDATYADHLQALAKQALNFKALAEKGLSGQALTEDDEKSVRWLPYYLEELEMWGNDFNYPLPPAALIADVATDPNTSQVLEVGTGHIHEIYVVAPIPQADGSLALTVARGGVMSYYEFASQERLTDEAWRALVTAGTTPAQPAFTTGFSVPQASSPAMQAAIYQYQKDFVNWVYYTGPNYYGSEMSFIVPVSDGLRQRAQDLIAALRAQKQYEGRQWVNTDYLVVESPAPDTMVITVRETWNDFLVQYTTPNPFDWYVEPNPAIDPVTARRGPYTVDVRYTLTRLAAPEHGYLWRVENMEELTERPAWGNP